MTPVRLEGQPRPPGWKVLRAALAVILLTVATAMLGRAVASPVYKSVEPDGDVVYGDAPVPGASFVERLKLVPPALLPQPVFSPSTATAEMLQSFQERHASLKSAHERMQEARAALAEAERRRAKAEEPLPGERLGNSNGTSRLRPEYFERLAGYDRKVAEAKASLAAAQHALREAR